MEVCVKVWKTTISVQTRAKINEKIATENAAWAMTDLFCSIFLLNHIEKNARTKIGEASDQLSCNVCLTFCYLNLWLFQIVFLWTV